MSERPTVEVSDNKEESRYEARVNGELAGVSFYEPQPDRLIVLHTEVRDAFEGQGVGSRLVAGMLDDVRRRGLSVTPLCPFTRAYIERHPEYDDLVAGR
ncbi:MAG TPA: GNAT family N-acetyltransferase [Gaiellaceae bacterium]|nr:GNAT family N-acetyltransferase [Gaiellaceae bacterium]